jgi:hypothetical protein
MEADVRGEQLARQWRILRTIESQNHGATLAELASQEGCHTRAIWRDLAAIQEAGFPPLLRKGRPEEPLELCGGVHISPPPALSGLVTFPWAVGLENTAMQSARSGCAKAASAPAILENGQRTRPRTRSARGKGIPSIKDQARETSQMAVFC